MSALLPLFAAAVSAPVAAPALAPALIAELPVPTDHGQQVVLVQARDFAPGAESGWHVHPGTEIAYVISGTMELLTAGGLRRIGPGESFVMPRGTAHNGRNPGSETARVVITLVVDREAPARQSVPAPEARDHSIRSGN